MWTITNHHKVGAYGHAPTTYGGYDRRMIFPMTDSLRESPWSIATGDSFRFSESLEQFQMIAQRACALVEINSALMHYVDTVSDGSPTADASLSRYAALGAMICRNTQLWMALVIDVRAAGDAFGVDARMRLRGLAKMAATCGQRVVAGKATPQLLIEINLGGLANLQEALSDLTHGK